MPLKFSGKPFLGLAQLSKILNTIVISKIMGTKSPLTIAATIRLKLLRAFKLCEYYANCKALFKCNKTLNMEIRLM